MSSPINILRKEAFSPQNSPICSPTRSSDEENTYSPTMSPVKGRWYKLRDSSSIEYIAQLTKEIHLMSPTSESSDGVLLDELSPEIHFNRSKGKKKRIFTKCNDGVMPKARKSLFNSRVRPQQD